MAPHACEGPIGGMASLHVDAASPNFLAQEICGLVDEGEKNKVWEDLMGFPAMRMVDGRYPMLPKPGLGVEISEEALKRYPFQGTRPFPIAFHEDGSSPRSELSRRVSRCVSRQRPGRGRDTVRDTRSYELKTMAVSSALRRAS